MSTKESNPKELAGAKKVMLAILSPVAKVAWALAQYAGLSKYGAWNWRAAGVRASTYISAMERHLEKYKAGQRLDPEDMTHHLGNIMACCAILMEAEEIGKLTDDRPPATVDIDAVFDDANATLEHINAKYQDRNPRHWNIADTSEIKSNE